MKFPFAFTSLAKLALAGGAAALCIHAHGAAPMARTQVPGYYRLMVGEVEVTALLDENSPWPENVETLFPQLKGEQLAAIKKNTHLQTRYDFSTNAYLLNTGKKLILIDAGGNGAGPGYGQLFANLKAAGYTPEQVDDIYITHMHPDHVFGLSEQGRRAFANATVHADARELAHWQERAAKGNQRAAEIVSKVKPYVDAGKYQTFDGETTFTPELKSLAAYGHSPGHSFYVVQSKGQSMQFWGDFVLNDKVHFELPELAPPDETDVARGVAMRKSHFGQAAAQGILIAGAHFAFPGVGRVRALGERFIWVPVDYAALPKAQ